MFDHYVKLAAFRASRPGIWLLSKLALIGLGLVLEDMNMDVLELVKTYRLKTLRAIRLYRLAYTYSL